MEEYFKKKTKELTLTIFNEKTFLENEKYRKDKNIKCLYSCNYPLWESEKGIFVLEGNISINKIVGIGFIKLNKDSGNYREIYETKHYNNYTYKGNYHIKRKNMSEKEEEVMEALDYLCFQGKTHLKRYSGIIEAFIYLIPLFI